MNKIVGNRIVWVDWAKTILITLVCVGHFNSPETQKLLIWGCHMPAFFLLSGFLYRRHNASKTLYSFVIPMMFYTTIVFGVHIIQDIVQNGYWNYQQDFKHFYYRIIEQFFIRNGENPYGIIHVIGIWFVIALIVARFVCGDIKLFMFTLKYKFITLSVLLFWLTIEPLIWDYIPIKDIKLYYGIYALPFFITGYIVKDLKWNIEKTHPLIIFFCLGVYLVISLNFPRFDMMNYQCGPTFMLFFVNALCGSLVLFWCCTKFPQCKWVEIFSIGTLLILTLHMPLDYFILPVFHLLGITPPNVVVMEYFVPWMEAFVVFVIVYYPIRFFIIHCPILLGKISSTKAG